MTKIDPAEYQKHLERLTSIFSDMIKHADQQTLTRCPYKNRFDQCTAKFGCQNKRKPRAAGELPVCSGDDKIDYRPAWETEPESFVRANVTDQPKTDSDTDAPTGPLVTCNGKPCAAQVGMSLIDHADDVDVPVPSSCGRVGICHDCIVQIANGDEALSARTEHESFLGEGYRLSCQAVLQRTAPQVDFSLLRRLPKILTVQDRRSTEIDPPVTRRGDSVYYHDKLIDKYLGHIYGLAVDVGTTTIVAELIDLETGASVSVSAFENPQRFGGSDVMNRISYDGGPFAGELHRALINMLNWEIQSMCEQLGIRRQMIYEILIVGNATMRDMFCDIDVQCIGTKPYQSMIEREYRDGKRANTALDLSTRKLGLYANRNARVFSPPLISGHVGADVTADLVAIDMASQDQVVMLVDVGTNTEIVIGRPGHLLAASAPAGPAFEGGQVKYGMPGCEGAIESIRYVDGDFDCKVIGDVAPQGICGSGLIDLLAELRRHDIMAPKGMFRDKARSLNIVPEHGITFDRSDASELAQAKAANTCGQAILMRKYGVEPDQISKLYLAGGFANYVDPLSAIEIGFLAPVPVDRIVKAGNAAAQGAREMLLSQRTRDTIQKLVSSIEHVELETTPDFFEIFVEACQFKPLHIDPEAASQ
jgi:uncharacterized 2Fe-2S/4Fe-4S cluster protein (DUF4445 family)